MDGFILRAGLAGLALVLATGPLGSFVVWRRMVYFGDAIAHAAVLGVAFGLLLAGPPVLWIVAAALAAGAAVLAMERGGTGGDTALGVVAHGGLAFGLIGLSFAPRGTARLDAILFGDILAVSWTGVAGVAGGALAIAGLIAWRWRALLLATLNDDLARARGFDPVRERAVLTLSLAVTVALALQVTGALLIGALLIIPAAAARRVATSPEAMAVAATAIGGLSVLGGLAASLAWDAPAGPAIVATAALVYAASAVLPDNG